MKTVKILTISLCIFLLLYCFWRGAILNYGLVSQLNSSSRLQKQLTTKRWEKVFFKEIDKRIENTTIISLHDKLLSPNSKEVRLWIGFDLQPLKGVILENIDDNWTAKYIPPINDIPESSKKSYLMLTPKSGWASFLARLENSDIFTLPDASEIGDDNIIGDARSIVIEIKTSDSYRNYMYNDLDTAKSEEAKKVLEITNSVSEELGISFY